MLTSTDASEKLECELVTVLGEKYFFKEYDTSNRRHYLDVFSVGLEVEREGIWNLSTKRSL